MIQANQILKRKYDVFFELYGKKMKATVMALSREDAVDAVKSKIIFHKVEPTPSDAFNVAISQMEDICEMLNKI